MTVIGNQAPREAATLFHDDFSGGFACQGPDARWELRPTESMAAGDGTVRPCRDGLLVEPTATNPATGEPAFALPADPAAKLEILRWSAFARCTSAKGIVGFDVPADGMLTATVEMSVRAFGSDGFPGNASKGISMAGAMITVDHESGLVFDFAFSNGTVYALYERLPRPDTPAECFSYAVPVATRSSQQFHVCSVSVDRAGGLVRWELDGEAVLTVSAPGLEQLDDSYLLWRRDGARDLVDPTQLRAGLGMFAMKIAGQGTRIIVRRMSVTTS
jgi:Family of unknown function (DUF6081)